MIVGIFGNLGSGKTLLSTILSQSFKQKHIVSNYKLNLTYEQMSVNKLLTFQYTNCLLLIDELYNYFESRISNSNVNLALSHFLFQIRKRNITLIFTSQLFSSIDKRLRALLDYYIVAIQNDSVYQYIIYDINKNISKIIYANKNDCKSFYSLYNTNEIINPEIQNENKLLYNIMSIEEKKDKIAFLKNKIEIEYKDKKITNKLIKSFCFKNNIPSFMVDIIYNEFKLESDENE